MLGSGYVIVIDDRCCMVQLGLRAAQFYMHESCGKCTPCREERAGWCSCSGRSRQVRRPGASSTPSWTCATGSSGTVCVPLGDAAAMPVASYVARFRDEYQRHIDEGGCPFGGESSLEGVLAPVDQHHAHVGARSRFRPDRRRPGSRDPRGHPGPPPAFERNAGTRAGGTRNVTRVRR